ncbi:type II/IV secretion system protein [Candidatus Parcubacteria bacterium]|nr:MAG: type II/IV secretion system protein [Candidatus Parcubacteria bacterium]
MPTDTIERELSRGEDVSIINIVDYLIARAYASKASDIHIDPTRDGMRVRMRVDGVLHDAYVLPSDIRSEIIARIKVLSHLRTDEHQMPQDGRFHHEFLSGDTLDVRVSIAPTYYGENVVLRLLSGYAEECSLQMLGLAEDDIKRITAAIEKQSGMILVTGPTGSGKTTTLYTLMRMINTPQVSIVSIEDPIEYSIDGVLQLQVNPRVGLSFANGLRTILRQDPNIIMVGEIRDAETAAISINTALTGHLLLSTLHTSDAATTIPRLLDMRAENFLVASTLRLSIGQRLVRKLCEHCKVRERIGGDAWKALSQLALHNLFEETSDVYKNVGCGNCAETGFVGRVCIAECLVVDDDMRDAILRRAPAAELKKIALESGMTTMLQDGFQKVLNGTTTIEEVLRVIHD